MLPHPHIQSPVAGGHIAAQLFLRGEAVLLPAAFAQQKSENFTKHRYFLPLFLISGVVHGFLPLLPPPDQAAQAENTGKNQIQKA